MRAGMLAGVSLSALALSVTAQAADLSKPAYKAAPVLAPAWSWTGFYVGANIGAARLRSSASDDPGAPGGAWIGGVGTAGSVDANSTGVIGGLQAGYNWQFGNVVLGAEGDISFASNKNTVTVTTAPGGADTYKAQLSSLATLRGRIGWAFDRTLIYGTGGVAFASLKNEYTDPPATLNFIASPSSSVTGWTAGAGVEYAFLDRWTVKAEYLHVDFGTRTASDNGGNGYVFQFKNQVDIGRVGINYKF